MGDARTVDSRVVAVQAMRQLFEDGRSFTTILVDAEKRVPSDARPRLRAVCFEWARWATQLEAIVDSKLDKPLRSKDYDVYLLMQLGVLELTHMNTPAHTAVNECVKALQGLKRPWAKGLVNAVLRNTQRTPLSVDSLNRSERYAYPDWWISALKKDWPDELDSILEGGNLRAPMTLRVNRLKSNVEKTLEQFDSSGLSADAHAYAPDAITLTEPVPVHAIPGFEDGQISVQDAAAQMIVPLLEKASVNPERILDACSAPGGKTAYLLEAYPDAKMLAIDHSRDRLKRVTDTLTRLSLNQRARTKACDAAELPMWWDGESFDLVLLDAPCTGSGVIRRHPDIKHTRRDDDVSSLAEQQSHLLQTLWDTVAIGGYLLYATCSVFKKENVHQVERFINDHDDATDVTPKELNWAIAQTVGYQVLPGQHDMDGFFYALIRKAGHG